MDGDQSTKAMKDAVRTFRIVELKQCLKMLRIRPGRARKAQLQKMVLSYIDSFKRAGESVPLLVSMKIYELERHLKNRPPRRGRKAQDTNISTLDQLSPFFEAVSILTTEIIKSHCTVQFSVPDSLLNRFCKRKGNKDSFAYEVQLLLTVNASKEWQSPTIRYEVNGNYADIMESPQIIYITNYCFFNKRKMNEVIVEFPFSEKEFKLIICVVKRLLPGELLNLHPVKEVNKTVDLLEKTFETNEIFVYQVSLVCPEENKIMEIPCRSNLCSHPDVFDLMSFLRKMQYLLKWKCPVCKKRITYDTLEVDPYFKGYLEEGKINFTFYKKRAITAVRDPTVSFVEEVIVLD